MLPQYAPGEAQAYLSARGIQFKVAGNELVVKQCLFCGKLDKLYVNNQTGAFQCKAGVCGQFGNYFTLRRDIGDPVQNVQLTAPTIEAQKPKKRTQIGAFKKFEEALLASPEAMDYLAQRGITEASAKLWHLGMKEDAGERVLMIPYIDKQGFIQDVKYRSMPPAEKRFWRKGGGESILYGEHLLPKDRKQKVDTLYLCEGELDAITLTQHGFAPALSTTTGAASFSPRWYDLIVSSGAKRIVLVYDSDVDGRAGAEKLVKKFNDSDREVLNVVLEDAKDANEYFQTHTAEDLKGLIQATLPAELDHVVSMPSAIDLLQEQLFMRSNGFNGIPSQFKNLNELIDGGYGNGYLITVVGASGTGKTSFLLQESLNIAKNHGPVYFCCLEMSVQQMLLKTINHLYRIPMKDVTLEHLQKYRADLETRGIYYGGGIRDIQKLADVFRKAHKRYDLKAIVFDNINFFVRSTEHREAELSLVSKTLKELAVELGIPIFLIAQPKKFDRADRIITESDVKDTSAIEQDSDIMILIWRPTVRTDIKDFGKNLGKNENLHPLTLFRVGKARFSSGGETLLYFHGEVGTFRAMDDDEMTRLTQEVAANKVQGEEERPRRGRRNG